MTHLIIKYNQYLKPEVLSEQTHGYLLGWLICWDEMPKSLDCLLLGDGLLFLPISLFLFRFCNIVREILFSFRFLFLFWFLSFDIFFISWKGKVQKPHQQNWLTLPHCTLSWTCTQEVQVQGWYLQVRF